MLFSSLQAVWLVSCVFVLCVCGWVLNCACVFQLWLQQRGATLAPLELSTHLTLLGLQVKAEYTCFSVLHPPTPPQFFVDAFSSLFSTHASPCWLLFRKFLGFFCSPTSVFFFFCLFRFNSLLQDVKTFPVESHVSACSAASWQPSSQLHWCQCFFFFELCPVSVGTWSPFLLFSVDHSFSPSGTCNVT